MTLNNRDYRKLLFPAIVTLALFSAAGLLAWWSHNDASGAAQERARATAEKNRIEARLRQFTNEETDLKARAGLMQRLRESGVLGEERRLDWIEQLRNLQRDLRLPGLKYEFSAQTPLNRMPSTAYSWYNSPLRLQMRLLHEVDLLNALDRIQHDASAVVVVRSCKLAPPAQNVDRRDPTPPLNADCDLDWLTARRQSIGN